MNNINDDNTPVFFLRITYKQKRNQQRKTPTKEKHSEYKTIKAKNNKITTDKKRKKRAKKTLIQ